MAVLDRVEKVEDHVLEQTLREKIESRTWRSVSRLEIHGHNGRVRISGSANSYYVKQLAVEAIMEVIRAMPTLQVTADIQADFGTTGD